MIVITIAENARLVKQFARWVSEEICSGNADFGCPSVCSSVQKTVLFRRRIQETTKEKSEFGKVA